MKLTFDKEFERKQLMVFEDINIGQVFLMNHSDQYGIKGLLIKLSETEAVSLAISWFRIKLTTELVRPVRIASASLKIGENND